MSPEYFEMGNDYKEMLLAVCIMHNAVLLHFHRLYCVIFAVWS